MSYWECGLGVREPALRPSMVPVLGWVSVCFSLIGYGLSSFRIVTVEPLCVRP